MKVKYYKKINYLDFMHNHSTLVLTIGSGLVIGGMWYMNNVGAINIGSLLTRLGIQIFSGNSVQNSVNTGSGGIILYHNLLYLIYLLFYVFYYILHLVSDLF